MSPEESGPDTFEVNQRLALICIDDPDRQSQMSAALQELGYRPHVGQNAADVFERLRKNSYEVVAVDETYQGSGPHDHEVLKHLQWMPMSTRRYMFVALLGPELKTFDNMSAFTRSVNVIVNYADVAKVKPILERGISDNDQFYRVFRQVLQEAGKR